VSSLSGHEVHVLHCSEHSTHEVLCDYVRGMAATGKCSVHCEVCVCVRLCVRVHLCVRVCMHKLYAHCHSNVTEFLFACIDCE